MFFEIMQTEEINNHPNWITNAKNRIIESFTKNSTQKPLPHESKPSYKTDKYSWNEIDSLLAIGEYSKASAILSKYPAENSNSERLLRLSKILLGMQHYQEAIDILKEISAFTDLQSTSIIELAMAYAALGNFTLARAMLGKLSEKYSQMVEFSYWYRETAKNHIEQGRKYFEQEFYQIALRCFEIALIRESNNKIALEFRDQCISKLSK